MKHCLPDRENMIIKTNSGQKIKVKKVHESKLKKKDELALVELDESITFNKTVRPICLPKVQDVKATLKDRSNTVGMILARDGSEYFYKKSVRMGRPSQCTAQPYNLKFNSRTMICAGNREDSCPGDSGSPLMYSVKTSGKHVVHLGGILIWGRDVLDDHECDQTVRYLAYAQLEKNIPWIRSLTGLN